MKAPWCFGQQPPNDQGQQVRGCIRCLHEKQCLAAACDRDARIVTEIPNPAHFAPADKPSNPKDIVGCDKLPLHLWPATATAAGCIALLNGALKYGRTNWRAIGVQASIYVDAAKRHLEAWFEGEEVDPDDGVPHLSAALACIAIIVDARAAGMLNDDRMIAGGHRTFLDEMTAHVKRLKGLHANRSPKHYTIADSTTVAGRQPGAPDAAPELAVAEKSVVAGKPATVTQPAEAQP